MEPRPDDAAVYGLHGTHDENVVANSAARHLADAEQAASDRLVALEQPDGRLRCRLQRSVRQLTRHAPYDVSRCSATLSRAAC